jgi:hypothetical protein
MPLNTNIWADRERAAPWTGLTQDTSRQIQLANENADEYLKERRGLGTITPGTEKSFDATGNLLSTSAVTSPAPRGLMTSSNSIDETGKLANVNYMDTTPDYRGAGLAQPATRSLPATTYSLGNNVYSDTAPTPSTPSTPAVVAQPGARDVELLRRLDQVDTTGALPQGVKSTMGATRSYAEPTSTSTQALAQSTVQSADPIADRLAEQRQAERGLAAKRAEPFLDPFKRIIFGKPAINPNLTYGLGR